MTDTLTPKPNSRLGFSCGFLFPSKSLIRVLTDIEEFCSWLHDSVEEDGTVSIFLHCKPSFEDSFFPNPDDVKNINFLKNYGFKCINRIDCRDRTTDRHETIIYHYVFKPEMDERDKNFLAEYHADANRYFKYDVLRKYGVTKR